MGREREEEKENICQLLVFLDFRFLEVECAAAMWLVCGVTCVFYSCILSVTEGYQYIIGDFSISVYYILLMSYVEMEGEKYFFEGQEQKKFLLHSFIHSFIIHSF